MTVNAIRFRASLLQTGKATTGIEVPKEIIAALAAGARPALAVRVNGYGYRTTVGVMGGRSLLPFSAAHRAASGLRGGDLVEVELALDTASRSAEMPQDLELAFAADPPLRAAFLRQAPSRQRADIENVINAKTVETRKRRIQAILVRLSA